VAAKREGSALINALFCLPFSGMRAAINVKHFTRDELCIVQVHHRFASMVGRSRGHPRLQREIEPESRNLLEC
jgi:hypothetical protein